VHKPSNHGKWSTVRAAINDWGMTMRLAFLLVIIALCAAVPVVTAAMLWR
jgi:hypothetical protein